MKERETQVQEELKLCVCLCVSVRVSVMDLGYQTKKKCKRQGNTINNDSIESNNRTWLICVREGAREGGTERNRELDKNEKNK